LVVITIIGILAALITTAAVAALRVAERTRIKAEMDQIDLAFNKYSQEVAGGGYPPNLVTDGTGPANPINEMVVLNELKRHLKKAFPRNRESDNLLRVLCGQNATGGTDAANYPSPLVGGMTAGEAVVFWLGGFSKDPKYPISGEGGPAYSISDLASGVEANEADPIESRNWVYPFEITRLMPRNDEGYFPDSMTSDGERFITYQDPQDDSRTLRINFWQYVPAKSPQPLLYFDVSRGDPLPANDSPATAQVPNLERIYAIKMLKSGPNGLVPKYANEGKFQLLHCGIDDEWGDFTRVYADTNADGQVDVDDLPDLLVYPEGPFTGEIADTIVNFSDSTLEDSQP
jgi:hypothetical protein